jgi:osmotically-inducible protein OsmY
MVSPSLNASRIDFDEELEKRVRDALRRPQVPGLRSVRPIAHAGAIVLRGHVATFYEKQLARTLSGRVPGVFEVVDELDVVKFSDPDRDDRASSDRGAGERDGVDHSSREAADGRQEKWFEFFRA